MWTLFPCLWVALMSKSRTLCACCWWFPCHLVPLAKVFELHILWSSFICILCYLNSFNKSRLIHMLHEIFHLLKRYHFHLYSSYSTDFFFTFNCGVPPPSPKMSRIISDGCRKKQKTQGFPWTYMNFFLYKQLQQRHSVVFFSKLSFRVS